MSEQHEFEEEEFSTKFNGQTLRRIIAAQKPYKWRVIGFLTLVAAVSSLDSVFTYMSKRIVDEGIVARNLDQLWNLLTIYGSLIVVQSIAVFGFIYTCGLLGEKVRYDLRKGLFGHLQTLSLSYYNKTPVGWIISRVTSDTERVSELVTWGQLDIVWSTLNILTSLYFMLKINAPLAGIVALIVPLIIAIAIWFERRILVEYREVRKKNSKITGTYNENITGVRVIKALNRETANLEKFGQLSGEMYRASYRAAWLSALFLPSVQMLSTLAIAVIVWYTGTRAGTVMGLTYGGLQAFISYVFFIIWPVQEMARVFAEMQQSVASAERIFSLMDAVPDVADRANAVEPTSVAGDIVFDNVNFWYEDGKPILSNFNLHVKAGEMIALVGPTGGGKSTIVNLVARFFEPKEGQIQINGIDYTQMTQRALQSRIGMVLQTPHLFSGTIRENIRYGRLDASDAEIEEAAQIAGAHAFISTLDKGYEEPVGEGGVLLSTGQKQLISLARAVLAQPDIFIMDEATSSVDTMTEALIQQGMDALLTRCTSFVIAHRLSTIRNADRILVIENGTIAESGTHSELLKLGGHYYRLYTQQFRNEKEEELDLWTEAFEETEETPKQEEREMVAGD
ncbi:MAG: ABC transporter ATP-binding protein [Caldilineaceae bacterium]